ncbi:MAG TPA: 2Fe-2S iron-sulfur cluster-binding protein [Myxococcales bacterium]|nr:2Fe-2S iron-sulfur cluster-binding protein [Myxococcales bacterium]
MSQPGSPPAASPTGHSGAVNTAGGQPGAAQGQAHNTPAVPKMVKVLVDGVEVEADSRDNLIEAARRVGVAIPYFCYHPRLSIAGQCRMCLVETSDAPGRLVPGCQVRVKEGLKIVTTTPAVKDNQRGSMEFHLINHPVDCAICDQSGECKLQDYYMEYDHQPSRIRTYKLNKPKREEFGPMVVYDAERCIMCTRCVRFMDEIAQEPQLAVVQRGSHSLISTFPGQPLDSAYSGNTVDICPVGALLNRDFRFQSRVWFVNKSPAICTGCSNGCNVYAESRGDQLYRLLPRRNEEVNQVWMCDEGRLTYHATNEKRVEWARSGEDAVGPRIAIERAVELLKPVAGQGGIAISISAQCTNEEATAALLLGARLKASKYVLSGKPAGGSDEFLIRADKNPNTNGVKLAAAAFGVKLEEPSALQGVKAVIAFRTDGLTAQFVQTAEILIVIAQNEDEVTARAQIALPIKSVYEQEGTLINYYGRLQRSWESVQAQRADTAAGWTWAERLLTGLGSPVSLSHAGEAFDQLAQRAPELSGLKLAEIPDDGLVLESLLPASFAARAPHPQAGAHSIRGPQTTPPGMKVSDEASGASR